MSSIKELKHKINPLYNKKKEDGLIFLMMFSRLYFPLLFLSELEYDFIVSPINFVDEIRNLLCLI